MTSVKNVGKLAREMVLFTERRVEGNEGHGFFLSLLVRFGLSSFPWVASCLWEIRFKRCVCYLHLFPLDHSLPEEWGKYHVPVDEMGTGKGVRI